MPVGGGGEGPGFVPVNPNTLGTNPWEFLAQLQQNFALNGVTISLPDVRDWFIRQYGVDPITEGERAKSLVTDDVLAQLNTATTYTSERATTQASVSTQFVDLPTAEAFLNDFERGTSAHIAELVKSGQLSHEEAALWSEPFSGVMDKLLDAWMAEIGQRAQRGEQIFRVVGAGGPSEVIGTRPGEGQFVDTTVQQQESTSAVGGGLPGATPQTETQQSTLHTTETAQSLENVVARPELGYVYAFSPADFLKQEYPTAGKLATFIEGVKGERRRIPSPFTQSAPTRIQ